MTTLPPMVKRPHEAPPAPRATNGKAALSQEQPKDFRIQGGRIGGPQRILIYGPGGIGKSSLAALAPKPVFLDIEEGTRFMDVPRVTGLATLADVRACLHSDLLNGHQTVVIDSATKAEEWAVAHTIATVKHEKGHWVSSLEGYGFGKGYQHVYETFLLFLSDLDAQIRAGRNVILIAHDCVADVPNPVGEDWIRYEPHLQSPKSGKSSIRNRVIQWADYVLFLGYDVVTEDGKGKGGGTRTIFTGERPDHIAKSRTAIESVPFESATDGAIWQQIMAEPATLKGGIS